VAFGIVDVHSLLGVILGFGLNTFAAYNETYLLLDGRDGRIYVQPKVNRVPGYV